MVSNLAVLVLVAATVGLVTYFVLRRLGRQGADSAALGTR